MAGYRHALPQLGGGLFATDGGIETTLIFLEGLELPDFAAFDLLKRPEGAAALRTYFRTYADIARRFGIGLILESATWRASRDWAQRLGYNTAALASANQEAINLLEELRGELETETTRIVVSGCIGPRGDGYSPVEVMSAKDAQSYHSEQVETFARTTADMVTAITMNYVEEAVGIAEAARHAGVPVAISFTVETDGRLPTGATLRAAIEHVDAATSAYPSYFMINCAHPTHFERVLAAHEPWTARIRGLRANASQKSHAELNESSELDIGNPLELGRQYAEIRRRLPRLTVLGGCCGTDHRHVEAIVASCSGESPDRAPRA
jgi:S-methylmethionine-dependent homocysteine/selenocysteine methylase